MRPNTDTKHRIRDIAAKVEQAVRPLAGGDEQEYKKLIWLVHWYAEDPQHRKFSEEWEKEYMRRRRR